MNRVWQEQLDKAGANPRDDYLISSSGLAAQLAADGRQGAGCDHSPASHRGWRV